MVERSFCDTGMPKGRPVPRADRGWTALILMGQWMIGIGLGILAQAFLVWGIFGHFLPGIGTGILQEAESVALYDLPTHVFHFFWPLNRLARRRRHESGSRREAIKHLRL